MIQRPPISTRTDTLVPYPTLCRARRRQAEARIALCARSAAFRRDGPLDELDGHDIADPAGAAARGQRHIAALKDRAVRGRRRRWARDRRGEGVIAFLVARRRRPRGRSEEHTSELQSLMRI